MRIGADKWERCGKMYGTDVGHCWKSPGFTAVVVLVLAVGIGGTTAMLSAIDDVMLRPCPYKDPDRLVRLYETDRTRTQRNPTSYAGFGDWQERSRVFEHLVGAGQCDCRVRGNDRTEKTRALFVSPGFFPVLGVQPILGRTFLPEEERPGGERVAILSYRALAALVWRRSQRHRQSGRR